jgi:hypothetical protein
LPYICGMFVDDDTESNCKYFSSRDYKRYEMLFELFDHSVDKHLPYGTQNTHSYQMKQKETMLDDEI